MNILIKLSSLVGLTIAPLIALNGGHGNESSTMMEGGCCGGEASMECHMPDMGCEMDAEGNCVIDSATCAEWLAAGKCDSSDCVKMENGKCHIKMGACKSMGSCEMDSEGNCIVDSATCAQWMASGKCSASDCVKMENGKCHIKKSACASMGGCGDHHEEAGQEHGDHTH